MSISVLSMMQCGAVVYCLYPIHAKHDTVWYGYVLFISVLSTHSEAYGSCLVCVCVCVSCYVVFCHHSRSSCILSAI